MIMHEKNMQELEHPASHLTDNYKKDENSNNYKLLDLGHQEHKEIMRNLRLIELWRNIDNAEGFTLDKIGKNVLELRNGRADLEYRKAIKIKIRGNLSAGLVEDFNVIGETFFGDNYEGITETWQLEQYNHEPAGLCFSVINLTNEQVHEFDCIRDILNEIKAGGVALFFIINLLLETAEAPVHISPVAFPEIETITFPFAEPETDFNANITVAGNAWDIETIRLPFFETQGFCFNSLPRQGNMEYLLLDDGVLLNDLYLIR